MLLIEEQYVAHGLQCHKYLQEKCSGREGEGWCVLKGFVDVWRLCSRKGVKMQTVTNGEL